MTRSMLKIKNLQVSRAGNQILQSIELEVKPGEIHAIMGPNGSGKSTLANVLSGHEDYHVEAGHIIYEDRDLTKMDPEHRARAGIFLAFQYPVEIPGVNNIYLLKAALNGIRQHQGKPALDAVEFLTLVKEKMQFVNMEEGLLHRAVNEGFSGGEKKRNEIFQMMLLEPKLAILDETDSGLDIDALKIVAQGVNNFHNKDRSIILVTHYQRLLNYIVPDQVHVLFDGRIIKSGDKSLALALEKKGYNWLLDEANAA